MKIFPMVAALLTSYSCVVMPPYREELVSTIMGNNCQVSFYTVKNYTRYETACEGNDTKPPSFKILERIISDNGSKESFCVRYGSGYQTTLREEVMDSKPECETRSR